MKRLNNRVLLGLMVVLSLLLYACATAKPVASSTDKKPQSDSQKKADSTEKKSVEKEVATEAESSESVQNTVPHPDKKLNIRKMSETEVQEREKRFDGTRYVGEGQKEFGKGLEFYFKTDCNQAISHWKNGLEDDAYAAPLAFNIALCLERESKVSEAEQWYKKAFDIDNNYTAPLYNFFLLKNRTQKAHLGEFEKLALKIPDDVHRYNFLAWIYYQVKQYSYAEENARKALKIDEQNYDAVVVLASVYFKREMFELARAALETAEKWNADDFRLQRLLGFVFYKLNRSAEAITHLQKAKQLNPELPAVLNLLSVLSFEIEDWETAKQNLEFLLDFYPQFAPAKLNLAIVYKQLKDYKKSLSLFQELEKVEKLSKDILYKVYYNMGVLYLDADIEKKEDPKRFDVASSYLQKALATLKGKKGVRAKRKMVKGYIKESQVEKRKLQIYLKAKLKREKRRKERAEEARKYTTLRKTKFEEAKKTDTLDGWKLFVEKYPPDDVDDDIATQAKARLAELDATMKQKLAEEQAAKAAKQGAFDLAKKSDTVALWTQFIKDFSPKEGKDDEMIVAAKARVDFLQKQAAKRANELEQYKKDRTSAFEKAKKKNSLGAWQNFLRTFPPSSGETDDQTSRFAKEQVIALQSQMEVEKQKEEEYKNNRRQVFGVAKQQGNIAAWEDFLKTFPPYKGGEDTMTYYAKMQIETLEKQARNKKDADYLAERAAAFKAVKQINDPNVYGQFVRDFPPLNGKDDATSRYIKKKLKQAQKKKDREYLKERAKAFKVVKQMDDAHVFEQFAKDFPPLNGKDDATSRYIKKRLKQLKKKK